MTVDHMRLVTAAGNLSARVVLVLPGEPFLEGPPASRICNSVDDIREALEEATRLKVSTDDKAPLNVLPVACTAASM